MTSTLRSFVCGSFVDGDAATTDLLNPATEEVVAQFRSGGFDTAKAYAYAREVGGAKLRAMGFRERAAMLKKLADLCYAKRDELIELGMLNAGNTRGDAKFDVDGAASVLATYAELGATLPEKGNVIHDGEAISLGTSSRLLGQHVRIPIEGVALLINAYNFPAWNFIEKAAASWLSGVPVVCKPATATACMAARLVERMIESGILPEGALSFVLGQPPGLVELLDERDALSFTGSTATGTFLRSIQSIRAKSVRLNIEADSVNAAILGGDVENGSETFDLFVNDLFRDLTQKAGQKCTAIRRAFVPESLIDAVKDGLASRLADLKIGDPAVDGVRMGPLASKAAHATARDGLVRMREMLGVAASGSTERLTKPGFEKKGFFETPTVFETSVAKMPSVVNEVEVFGPASTLIAYDDVDAMLSAVRKGGGSLVASVYSDDRAFLKKTVLAVSTWHGRVYVGTKKTAGGSIGPGTALPQLKHGGPGRAGGGEELGGLRALDHTMHRVAIQGYGPMVEAILAP